MLVGDDAGVETGDAGLDEGGTGATVVGAGADGPLHEKTEGPDARVSGARHVAGPYNLPGMVYEDSFW